MRSAGKPVRDVPGLYFGYGLKPVSLRRTSTSTQLRSALLEQPSGVGGQLSAERVLVVTQVTVLGLVWAELLACSRPLHLGAGTGTYSCKIAASPPCADAAAGFTWQVQGHKYPVRALHRSLPATSHGALLLHHKPFR